MNTEVSKDLTGQSQWSTFTVIRTIHLLLFVSSEMLIEVNSIDFFIKWVGNILGGLMFSSAMLVP